MDAALLSMMRSGGRNRAWAETMVNLEARKLEEAANVVSGFHLRDSLTRLQFVQKIRDVVEKQFAAARQARTDEDCIACIKKLREERLQHYRNLALQYQRGTDPVYQKEPKGE